MEPIYLILISAISVYGFHAVINKLCETFLKRNLGQIQNHILTHGKVFYKRPFFGHSYNEYEKNRNRKQGTRIKLALMPLILCRVCMTSTYGSIFYWAYGWILGGATVTAWIPSLFAIAGVLVYLIRTEK